MNVQTKAILFATALGGLAAGAASAQSLSWDLVSEYGQSSIMGVGNETFVREVAERSDGAISITAHYDGSIGYASADHLDAVAVGAVELADTVMGAVAGIEPIFLLSSLPFVASSNEEARLLFEAARPAYEDAFERNNQVLLWATPWPPSGIWARSPITSQDQLSQLRIRAWDASGVRTMGNAGATAIQVSWADTVPQLASGAINAVLTSADGGVSVSFWDFLDHFTAVNYSMALNMTHMNRDVFDSLSDAQRQIVLDAAAAAEDAAWAELSERVARNYATMGEHGVTITETVPDEFREALVAAGQQVYDDWLAQVGPVGQEILDAYNAARGH